MLKMVKFAYIVANYFGGRHSENTHDSTYYLRRHIEFLRRHDIDELELSIMVINIQTDKDIKLLSDSIRELPIEKQNKIQIINRKNIDGSYGAWEDGVIWLINNRPDIEYAMPIEDDYIPVCGK
jgi:hypothetical protein